MRLNAGSYLGAECAAKPSPEHIPLTFDQIQSLRRYIDHARSAAAAGRQGMLVAQIAWDNEGSYWLLPAFLDHVDALTVTGKGRRLR